MENQLAFKAWSESKKGNLSKKSREKRKAEEKEREKFDEEQQKKRDAELVRITQGIDVVQSN